MQFSSGESLVLLRLQEGMILYHGIIYLGAPFKYFKVPTANFGFQSIAVA